LGGGARGVAGSGQERQSLDIGDLLDRTAVGARVNANSKRQALSVVSEIAARAFDLKSADILTKLLQRERLGSTGVGHGVAVPHCRLRGLERVRGVFLRLESPIDFGAVDEQPVDLIFALLAPLSDASEQLRALARVSRVLRQTDLRQQLRQARSVDAILALLVQEQRPSAA
jgi:PTS system nitrogen regulatory IIA component